MHRFRSPFWKGTGLFLVGRLTIRDGRSRHGGQQSYLGFTEREPRGLEFSRGAEISQHVEAAKDGLLFARRGGSVTFAHPFQPIRRVEQFLLDFRDLRLSC